MFSGGIEEKQWLKICPTSAKNISVVVSDCDSEIQEMF